MDFKESPQATLFYLHMLKLPGLIDPHVHLREPGAIHKEDWDSGTCAALAGGFTMLLAMPNTQPPILDGASLELALLAARGKARCDYAQFVGAGAGNADAAARLAPKAATLKMYLDQTYGELRLDDMSLWHAHFEMYPREFPIVVHAEGRNMAAAILFAAIYDRPVHVAHISLKEEILLIKAARQHGIKITCEVTPHHLFLTTPFPVLGEKEAGRTSRRMEVRPRLATQMDVDALWNNLDVIDCFATDHAPHTLAEKDSTNPPPGFPGLETALPLLLTAVDRRRLTVDDLIQKMVVNPRRIFGLPEQSETWIEIDEDAKYTIKAADLFTRCGWTPFEGWPVRGRLRRVVLRGVTAFEDGKILVKKGFGRNVRG